MAESPTKVAAQSKKRLKYLYVDHGDRFVQPELLALHDDQAAPDDWSSLKLKDTRRAVQQKVEVNKAVFTAVHEEMPWSWASKSCA